MPSSEATAPEAGWAAGAVYPQDLVFSWHHAGHGAPGRGAPTWAPRPPSPRQEHRAAFQILPSPGWGACEGRGGDPRPQPLHPGRAGTPPHTHQLQWKWEKKLNGLDPQPWTHPGGRCAGSPSGGLENYKPGPQHRGMGGLQPALQGTRVHPLIPLTPPEVWRWEGGTLSSPHPEHLSSQLCVSASAGQPVTNSLRADSWGHRAGAGDGGAWLETPGPLPGGLPTRGGNTSRTF